MNEFWQSEQGQMLIRDIVNRAAQLGADPEIAREQANEAWQKSPEGAYKMLASIVGEEEATRLLGNARRNFNIAKGQLPKNVITTGNIDPINPEYWGIVEIGPDGKPSYVYKTLDAVKKAMGVRGDAARRMLGLVGAAGAGTYALTNSPRMAAAAGLGGAGVGENDVIPLYKLYQDAKNPSYFSNNPYEEQEIYK